MSEMEITYGRRITQQVYYEGRLTGTVEQVEQEMFTDRNRMLKDVIEALAVITSGQTKKLELDIQLDSKGRYKLTQRWRIS